MSFFPSNRLDVLFTLPMVKLGHFGLVGLWLRGLRSSSNETARFLLSVEKDLDSRQGANLFCFLNTGPDQSQRSKIDAWGRFMGFLWVRVRGHLNGKVSVLVCPYPTGYTLSAFVFCMNALGEQNGQGSQPGFGLDRLSSVWGH